MPRRGTRCLLRSSYSEVECVMFGSRMSVSATGGLVGFRDGDSPFQEQGYFTVVLFLGTHVECWTASPSKVSDIILLLSNKSNWLFLSCAY